MELDDFEERTEDTEEEARILPSKLRYNINSFSVLKEILLGKNVIYGVKPFNLMGHFHRIFYRKKNAANHNVLQSIIFEISIFCHNNSKTLSSATTIDDTIICIFKKNTFCGII